MGKGALQRLAPTLVVILLLAAGAGLGVLQVTSVSQATHADEVQQRFSLDREASQAANDAEDGIRVLLSFARSITPSEFATENWAAIISNLQLWYSKSPFPDLVRSIYIIRSLPAGGALVYSKEGAVFKETPLPADLRGVVPTLLSTSITPRSWPTTVMSDARRVVLVPISFAGAVLVVLDTNIYYEKVLPYFVARDAGANLYRVVVTATGAVLSQTAGLPPDREPDARVGVSSLPVQDFGMDGGMAPPKVLSPSASTGATIDPLLQSWLQKASGVSETLTVPPDRGGGAITDEVTLQIFYPRGSLSSTMRVQETLSIAFSLGILAVLMVSVFVLARLYRRSVMLRTSEQEFVASISHELRTPISVIQATSDNLSRGVVVDATRLPRYAEVIHGQIKRLSGMVESILLYAGLQSGKSRPPSLTEIDLASFLSDVVQPLQVFAGERATHLRVVAEDLPRTICSDTMALRLIVENLVMNALRHAAPGDVLLMVRQRDGQTLEVLVEDHGPGIPAREQTRVFQPFVRGERSTRDQIPGSGLGLHLVRRVVALLGGRVTLESPYRDGARAVQKGCRFSVQLPFKEKCIDA
jgi:signal transduction histidine kinase